MKQKDIALIAVISIVSAFMSFFVSHALFAAPKDRQEKVEVVQPISTKIAIPDSKYFNENSIDPTRLIQIGNGANTTPFNSQIQ